MSIIIPLHIRTIPSIDPCNWATIQAGENMRYSDDPSISQEKLLAQVLRQAANGKAMHAESKRGCVQEALQAGYIEPNPTHNNALPGTRAAILYRLTQSGHERLAQLPAPRSFATQEVWEEAAKMAASGSTLTEIAKKFDTTLTSVTRWIDRHKKLMDLEKRRSLARNSRDDSSKISDDALLDDVMSDYRIMNILRFTSISTVGDARRCTDVEYLGMPNFGKTSLKKLRGVIGYADSD